jgi:hypothetical protein
MVTQWVRDAMPDNQTLGTLSDTLNRTTSASNRLALEAQLETLLLEVAVAIPLVGAPDKPEQVGYALVAPSVQGLLDRPPVLQGHFGHLQSHTLTSHNIVALRHVWLAAPASPDGG